MKGSSFFLRTKLLPPRAGSELLERPRLIDRLEANIANPITLVAADAGSGKTTLIADFVRRQRRKSIWYQLDHTDADPAVFLGYVAQGIKNIVDDFGDTIFSYLSEAGEDILRYPERAADLLINEVLGSVEEPFILVLDDYHHIGRDTVVHKIVDRIVQYSSDLLHLIITTRDLPPLAMMRRRSQSAALVIMRDDLLFTDGEVRSLFHQTLGVDLKDIEVADYRERTNGWITALQLVRQLAEQKLHSGSTVEKLDLTDILKQSERDISDYFAEEVFSREPEETQRLLLRLSMLESLDLETCGQLFPEMRCSALLPELAQKNVFLTVAGDGKAEEYRFHPLFRDFLRRRSRAEIGRSAVAAERGRIAEHFIALRQWETALPYLIDSEKFDRAAEIMSSTGSEWIAAGAFTSLRLFTDRIPADVLERFPRAMLYRGEVLRLHGEIQQASMMLRRAAELLHGGDNEGEAESLHALASIARRKGNFGEAYELLDRAADLIDVDSETYIKCANTRGLCMIVQGDWVEAEKQFRIALDAAERQGNERYVRVVTHNLALAPGFRGDFGEALRWFKRIFREDRAERQLPQEAIGHLNVARLHLYRGEFDDTEKHLERALELCQLYNMRLLRGEIFEAYGNYYREKQDIARADEYYERALTAYEEAEVDVSTKELDEERGAFYMMRGDLPRARAVLERLIQARTAQANQTGVNTAKLRLLQLDLLEMKTGGVAEETEKLLKFFKDQGQYYYEALSSMLFAEALYAEKRVRETIEPVRRTLDLSARLDYDYWLRGEIRRNPQIFGIEEIAERLPADLRKELEKGAVEAAGATVSMPLTASSVTDLTVRVLGHPDIHRDPDKPLAPDAWTTRRARDIFCYIATSKQRRVAKDVLIEAFWPSEDPAAIEKNFHPTISHVRKALNSRQSLKQNFILFREGAYQLNPELSYSIDTEEFERLIADAEAAKREKNTAAFRSSLEQAYALYRGEFMSGIYDEWAEERRGFYVEQFGRVVSALAKLALSENRWGGATKYANELLKIDPFREDMHRLLMKVLAAQSKPAAVKKQFEALSSTLRVELGIEPAAETRRLYQELLRSATPAVER
jgi:LuxR family maltose regulon positive regulatory protein